MSRMGRCGFLSCDPKSAPDRAAKWKGAKLLMMCGDIHPNPGPCLKMMQMNVDGMRSRKTELCKLLGDYKPDVMSIQETKLDEDKQVSISGYTCFKKDRVTPRRGNNVKGGGLIILVKDCEEFSCQEVKLDNINGDNTTERMAIEIIYPKWKCTVYNVYVPPIWEGTDDERTQNFNANVCLPTGDNIIITGDFNAHHHSWDSRCEENNLGVDIANWIIDNNIQLGNTGEHTYNSNRNGRRSSPDLSMASKCIIRKWETLPALNTEHLPIAFEVWEDDLDLNIYEMPRNNVMQTRYSWKKANWEQFSKDVDDNLENTQPKNRRTSEMVKWLTKAIVKAGRNIPRGCRKDPKVWWSEEIADKVDERNRLRDKAHLSEEDCKEWKDKSEEVRKLIREQKTIAWKEHLETLSNTTNTAKAWRTIKAINRDQRNGGNVTIKVGEKSLCTNKAKAEAYNKMYAKVARKVPEERDISTKRRVNIMKDNICKYTKKPKNTGPDSDFTMAELKYAISKLGNNRAAGKDEVYNEMILNLSDKAKEQLLEVINTSWRRSEVPSEWRLGIIKPLPKPGKDPSKMESFRPVTLTSCLGKLAERLVGDRIVHDLESNQKLSHAQAGFRAKRSTTDPITRIVEDVTNGFQCQKPHKRTLATLVDFARAFDKVDHLRLLNTMVQMKIPSRACAWTKAFLSNRKAMCQIGNTYSKQRVFSAGVPQGSVTGPILFVIYIDSLAKRLENIEGIQFGFFADDLTIWGTNQDIKKVSNNIQMALNVVNDWCKEYNMKVAPEKCENILFSNWTGDKAPNKRPNISIDGKRIDYKESVKLLGIYLDTGLTFNQHIAKVRKEAGRRIGQLKALANTEWGCSPVLLRTFYVGYIRSIIEYGSDIWGPMISKTNLKQLETIQNAAARTITGCVNTTNIESLLLEGNLIPIEKRILINTTKRVERMLRMPVGDPLRNTVESEIPRQRLVKRNNWRIAAKNVMTNTKLTESITKREELVTHLMYNPWDCDEIKNIEIHDELIEQAKRSTGKENEKLRRDITLRTLTARGQHDIEIWSDGSVKNEIGAGAALIFRKESDEEVARVDAAAGHLASSCRAEMAALNAGLNYITNNTLHEDEEVQSILICTDSQSTIKALQRGPLVKNHNLQMSIWKSLMVIAKKCKITIQFVAAHCGTIKNEKADQAANTVFDRIDAKNADIGLESVVAAVKKRVAEMWAKGTSKDTFRARVMEDCRGSICNRLNLSRKENSIISQLRCGECRSLGTYPRRVGIIEDPKCRWCGENEETIKHVLADCSNRDVRMRRRHHKIQWLLDLRDHKRHPAIINFLDDIGTHVDSA